MSIKTDRWIIQQSTRPTFVVTERVFDIGNPPTAMNLSLKDVHKLSTLSEEEIQTLMAARQTLSNSSMSLSAAEFAGIIDYRVANDADLVDWKPMIEPFFGSQVRYKLNDKIVAADRERRAAGLPATEATPEQLADPELYQRVISYGTSSFGYDVRIADEFKIFTNINSTRVDPKAFDDKSFVDFKGPVCVIPPNSFVLAHSVEYFRMPRNVSGLVLGKSTYARCGVNCIATPLEPGWEGHITLEYINGTPLPALLYANEGAAQVQFFEGEQPIVSYADRGGKYQGQRGITLPRA